MGLLLEHQMKPFHILTKLTVPIRGFKPSWVDIDYAEDLESMKRIHEENLYRMVIPFDGTTVVITELNPETLKPL